MSVREYVGARYIPLFMGDWDVDADYEPLSVVLYQGASYTSRQSVPHGVAITNTDYWALSGNYNAQVEAYREEVQTFDDRITTNAGDISDLTTAIGTERDNRIQGDLDVTAAFQAADADIVLAYEAADTAIDAKFGSNISAEHTVRDALDSLRSHYDNMIGSGFSASNSVRDQIDKIGTRGIIIISDSYAAGSSNQLWVPTWPSDIGTALNADIENLSVTATGWVAERNGNTFLTQCQDARDNATFINKDRVDIIIYGGLNDISGDADPAVCRTNFRQGLAALRTTYPKAHIYICGCNLSLPQISAYQWPDMWQMWQNVAFEASANTTFIDARGWLCSDNESYASDNVHPIGNHGNDILKVKFLSILEGNEAKYTVVKPSQASDTTGSNDWVLNSLRHCKMVCCEGRYKLLGYKWTDFDTYSDQGVAITSANVGRRYLKGSVTFPGVFEFPNLNSTRNFNGAYSGLEPFMHATDLAMPFRVMGEGSGNKINVWYEITRDAPASAQTPASGSYCVWNGEWSVFGD